MTNEKRTYSLPKESLPGIEIQHHVDDLEELCSFLESRHIATTNTRIRRYIQYFEQVINSGTAESSTIFKNSLEGPFKSDTDWFLYLLREVHELMWILKGLKVRLPEGIDEKLKCIVGGRDFATLDSNSSSRNAQFELRIASYFCQENLPVDLSSDTDIIVLTENRVLYIECKRIASGAQLRKRLSEAKLQLRRGMPRKVGRRSVYGCIAADVTKMAFSHNGLNFAVTSEHARDVIQDKLTEIANEAEKYPLFEKCPGLLNYWLQIHIPSLVLQPCTPTTRFSSIHVSNESLRRKERKALSSLYEIFERASERGDTRKEPAKPLMPLQSFCLPRGTTFTIDEDLLLEFLSTGTVTCRDAGAVVGTLCFDGETHTFSLLDFQTIIGSIEESERAELAHDPVNARFQILVKMYEFRFLFAALEE